MDAETLLRRLDEIGRSLARSRHALALLALGSVGIERERIDAYSDLDFFAIVEPGHKRAYIDDLSWLSALCPIAYAFQNTADGHKLLFEDGIFCEFAVFEPAELAAIPFSPGRLVWARDDFDGALSRPATVAASPAPRNPAWLLGEALTNLYVGMGRDRRGERLAAMRLIQVSAVDRLLELAATLEAEQSAFRDRYANERRFEQRYPQQAGELPGWTQGYAHNRESAISILAFLERHFAVNAAMAEAIRRLCGVDSSD